MTILLNLNSLNLLDLWPCCVRQLPYHKQSIKYECYIVKYCICLFCFNLQAILGTSNSLFLGFPVRSDGLSPRHGFLRFE